MSFVTLMLIAFPLGFLGEFLCKMGSQCTDNRMYAYMAGAALCWGSGGYIWTMIYKQKAITEVIAIYNPCQMVLLATMGVVMFSEPFTWKLALAYVLTGICVWLLK